MNESRHPIDDLFRDGLDQYSVDAPMHVWERIDRKRTPVYKLANNLKQNSRWYIAVASGLILMSSAAMFFLHGEFATGKLSMLDESKTEATAGNNKYNGQHPANGAAKNGTYQPATEGTLTAPASEHAMEGEGTSEYRNTPQSPRQAAPTARPEQPLVNPVAQPPVNNGGIRNNNRNGNADPNGSPDKAEKPPVVVPPYEIPKAKEQTNEEGESGTPGYNPYTPGKGGELNNELPKEQPPVAVVEPKPEEAAAPLQPDGKEEKQLPPTPSRFSLELLGSYDIVNRSISHPNAAYTGLRNSSEKVNYGYSIQLRGQYRVNNAISLRAGLNFSRIGETLNYNAPETYQEIQQRLDPGSVIDPFVVPNPIVVPTTDTVSRIRYTPVSSKNSYTFIDVPVLLNYTYFTGKKISLNASAGPMFNLAFLQTGKIVGPVNNEVIDLNSASNPFRSYAGMSLMLNLGISYEINRNFDLMFEPGARFGLGSLTGKGFDMTQRYSIINLFTGVRYKF